MNKFTPGPWFAKQSNNYNYQVHIFTENNNSPLGMVYGNLDDSENGANARLIASAPELLESLELLLNALMNCTESELTLDDLRKIEKLIEKARGSS